MDDVITDQSNIDFEKVFGKIQHIEHLLSGCNLDAISSETMQPFHNKRAYLESYLENDWM